MSWKRNLVVIWLSQFLSIMGFSFALPFAPYFIQELGVREPAALQMWIAAFAAATPLSLAIFSPIWGALADRYGRRAMLMRANFAGWIVMSMMGGVHSVQVLIFLRFLQGVFTGTMTAAQAMVASTAPEERSGLALGALSAAVFSGGMVGNFLGGVCSYWLGYRMSFFVSGFLLLISGLLVLFGTREHFVKPAPSRHTPMEDIRHMLRGASLPILLLIMAIAFARQFDSAYVPLLVQDIHGSLQGVSLWAGFLQGFTGIAGLLAGVILGRWADHHPPPRIGQLSALGAAVLLIPQALAQGFLLLFAARFGMIFWSGGLDPVFQIWLSKVTPQKRRGTVFGWAATFRSIGWMISPLLAGTVAAHLGVRWVFIVGAILFLALIPCISVVVRHVSLRGHSAP
jgi:DHA1 family multidrug resistance protein-like MFS transporter